MFRLPGRDSVTLVGRDSVILVKSFRGVAISEELEAIVCGSQ